MRGVGGAPLDRLSDATPVGGLVQYCIWPPSLFQRVLAGTDVDNRCVECLGRSCSCRGE